MEESTLAGTNSGVVVLALTNRPHYLFFDTHPFLIKPKAVLMEDGIPFAPIRDGDASISWEETLSAIFHIS